MKWNWVDFKENDQDHCVHSESRYTIFIYFPEINRRFVPGRLSCPPSTARVTRAMHSRPANPGRLTWAGTLSLFYLSDKRVDMHQHAICAALERRRRLSWLTKAVTATPIPSSCLAPGRRRWRVMACHSAAAWPQDGPRRRGRRGSSPPRTAGWQPATYIYAIIAPLCLGNK